MNILIFIILLILLPFLSSIDIAVSKAIFFNKTEGFSEHPIVLAVDDFGHVPALLLFFSGLCTFFYFRKKKRQYAMSGLYVVLTLATSFVLSYCIIKPFFQRARPQDLTVFGKNKEFTPFYSPGKYTNSKSFPSGHAANGAYFFTLFFLGRRLKNRLLQLSGLISGLCFSVFFSFCRIVQGVHFFSDVFFGVIIMWYIAYGMDILLLEERHKLPITVEEDIDELNEETATDTLLD